MIFLENLTLLYSSHLKVFLIIFYFLNSNLNFEFGQVGYRPKPEPAPAGFFNPASLPPSLCFLNVSLVSEREKKNSLLPCSRSSFPGGDAWASGGPALCRRRAHPPGMPRPPLLFPCAVRDGAPQTLTKLSVFGSESSYNILSYLLTWISFARTRIIGCTCVHPCLCWVRPWVGR